MQITFADGTKMEVKESALDAFLKHDLKWVEFVHGRASVNAKGSQASGSLAAKQVSSAVKRCPPGALRGC